MTSSSRGHAQEAPLRTLGTGACVVPVTDHRSFPTVRHAADAAARFGSDLLVLRVPAPSPSRYSPLHPVPSLDDDYEIDFSLSLFQTLHESGTRWHMRLWDGSPAVDRTLAEASVMVASRGFGRILHHDATATRVARHLARRHRLPLLLMPRHRRG